MGGGASVPERDLLFPYQYSLPSIRFYLIAPARAWLLTMGIAVPRVPQHPGESQHVDKYNDAYITFIWDYGAVPFIPNTLIFPFSASAELVGLPVWQCPPHAQNLSARPRFYRFQPDFFAVFSTVFVGSAPSRQILPEELSKIFGRVRKLAEQCRAVMQIRAICDVARAAELKIFATIGEFCLFGNACAVMEPEISSFGFESKPVARSSQSRAQPTFDAPESILLSHSLFHVYMLGVGLERGVFGLVGLMMGLSFLSQQWHTWKWTRC